MIWITLISGPEGSDSFVGIMLTRQNEKDRVELRPLLVEAKLMLRNQHTGNHCNLFRVTITHHTENLLHVYYPYFAARDSEATCISASSRGMLQRQSTSQEGKWRWFFLPWNLGNTAKHLHVFLPQKCWYVRRDRGRVSSWIHSHSHECTREQKGIYRREKKG